MVNDHQLYNQLVEMVGADNVVKDQPLKNYTYTRLGGNADYFVTPETYEQVQQIVMFSREHQVPLDRKSVV